jgi:hypothetical protein
MSDLNIMLMMTTPLSAVLQNSQDNRSTELEFQDLINWLQALPVQQGFSGRDGNISSRFPFSVENLHGES